MKGQMQTMHLPSALWCCRYSYHKYYKCFCTGMLSYLQNQSLIYSDDNAKYIFS